MASRISKENLHGALAQLTTLSDKNSAVFFISLYQMMDTASSHFGDHREKFQFQFVFSLAPYESKAHTLLCVSLRYFWTLLAYVFPV